MKITVFDRAVSTYKPLLKWTTTAPPSEKSMLRHSRSFQVIFKSFAAGFRSFQVVSGRFRSFQLVLTFINDGNKDLISKSLNFVWRYDKLFFPHVCE